METAKVRGRERTWLIGLHVVLLAVILAAWAAEAVWGRGAPAMLLGSGFRKYCVVTSAVAGEERWLALVVLGSGLLFVYRKELVAGGLFAAVLVAAAVVAECACGRFCVWPLDVFG